MVAIFGFFTERRSTSSQKRIDFTLNRVTKKCCNGLWCGLFSSAIFLYLYINELFVVFSQPINILFLVFFLWISLSSVARFRW